jgi:ABC-type lipoprotein release transport system permease subunit
MRKLMRGFDAALGGFTLGEKAGEGERNKALLVGAALLFPLLLKRRIAMLAFALGVAALTAVAVGLLPALRAARTDPTIAIRAD